MKKLLAFMLMGCMLLMPTVISAREPVDNSSYTMIIEGQDWGPAVTKLVIQGASSTDLNQFEVQVLETLDGEEIVNQPVKITEVYYSDEKSNPIDGVNEYVALSLEIGPENQETNPFYFDFESFSNSWVDMQFTITQTNTQKTWNQMGEQFKLVADEFEKNVFTYEDSRFKEMNLSYASYFPKEDDKKNALIIWLHGMGEGGTDPDLVLLGNEVTNLAKDPIQSYFEGAYVLAPQSPTFWMDQGDGNMTIDGSSMYSESLFALIDSYVQSNPDIDTDRIIIGGCSNGGYMTMRMVIDHPEYFAAAFPICEAFIMIM